MKRICHMTSVHKRHDGRILKKECVSLANAGYDVTLIVADNQDDEFYKGVKITSIDFHPKTRIDRIINSKKKMLKKALEIGADVYHFHDPELIPVGLALLKRRRKVIYDSHEDYPLDIKFKKKWMPAFIRPLVSAVFAWYEMYAARQFSAVISVTPQITSRFYKSNMKSYTITNYPIVINETMPYCSERKQNINICFAGLVGMPWFQESIVSAIQNINLHYIIAGPIKEKYLKKLLALDKNNRINYVGIVKQDDVFDIYKNSCIGMAIASYDPTDYNGEGSLGITKLFEYMMFGLPIICTDFSLWKDIINKWQCGICVSPEDIDAIRNAVDYLVNTPCILEKMSKNARNAALAEYNWTTQEKLLLSVYSNIVMEN